MPLSSKWSCENARNPRLLAGQPGAAIEAEISTAHLPPKPDLTGRQLGTYRVGQKLTESFWDKVCEADQTSIGRPVALHVLRSSLCEIPERVQEFLETASANANIHHPAILPVYEAIISLRVQEDRRARQGRILESVMLQPGICIVVLVLRPLPRLEVV